MKKVNGHTLNFTKREISELAATTVETTIRVINEFQKKRWIASERGKIRLNDVAKLQGALASRSLINHV